MSNPYLYQNVFFSLGEGLTVKLDIPGSPENDVPFDVNCTVTNRAQFVSYGPGPGDYAFGKINYRNILVTFLANPNVEMLSAATFRPGDLDAGAAPLKVVFRMVYHGPPGFAGPFSTQLLGTVKVDYQITNISLGLSGSLPFGGVGTSTTAPAPTLQSSVMALANGLRMQASLPDGPGPYSAGDPIRVQCVVTNYFWDLTSGTTGGGVAGGFDYENVTVKLTPSSGFVMVSPDSFNLRNLNVYDHQNLMFEVKTLGDQPPLTFLDIGYFAIIGELSHIHALQMRGDYSGVPSFLP